MMASVRARTAATQLPNISVQPRMAATQSDDAAFIALESAFNPDALDAVAG